MARVVALTAPAALGLSDAPFHEPFHARSLTGTPAVVEALHATGEHDYLLRLRCQDTSELHQVVRSLKSRHGAARTLTRVVLGETVIRRPRLP